MVRGCISLRSVADVELVATKRITKYVNLISIVRIYFIVQRYVGTSV